MRDEITLGDSLIVPAIRYDSIGDVGTRWSPKLGWRHELNDALDVKANWGAAFRAPTFEELYRQEGFITGNPDLLPEKTQMADFGFVYEKKPWRIEADYFKGRAKDLIEYVPGSGHRYHPLNFGRAKLSGFEVSLKYDLCDAWRIEGNVAHTDAIDASAKDSITYGRQIPGRPKWDAYAGILYNDPAGDWGGHIAAYFAGGRFLTAANTRELGDDMSINIGFTYALSKGTDFAFEVKNLLDESLLDVRGFPLPGRTFVIGITQEV
jgi:outer membrane receptor protein involved in Fe transport